jgi:hypothetical protein
MGSKWVKPPIPILTKEKDGVPAMPAFGGALLNSFQNIVKKKETFEELSNEGRKEYHSVGLIVGSRGISNLKRLAPEPK